MGTSCKIAPYFTTYTKSHLTWNEKSGRLSLMIIWLLCPALKRNNTTWTNADWKIPCLVQMTISTREFALSWPNRLRIDTKIGLVEDELSDFGVKTRSKNPPSNPSCDNSINSPFFVSLYPVWIQNDILIIIELLYTCPVGINRVFMITYGCPIKDNEHDQVARCYIHCNNEKSKAESSQRKTKLALMGELCGVYQE